MAKHKKNKAKRAEKKALAVGGAPAPAPAPAVRPTVVAPANPFTAMRRFAEEMDRAFGGFGLPSFPRFEAPWGSIDATWMPAVEVAERGGTLIVRAELPGLTKDDVKVDVTDDRIRIQGERREERKEKRKGLYRTERRYGSFFREIPLPPGVDPEQAKAAFRDGVLEVTLPAPPPAAGGRRIPIEPS